MNEQFRPLRAAERWHESERRVHVNDLMVAYFIRGIRSLDATPRGRALETRRVWSATSQSPTTQSPRAGRDHPWD